MLKQLLLIVLLESIAIGPAYSQDSKASKATLTARDMYISCFLFVRRVPTDKRPDGQEERFAPQTCGVMSLSAITYRESNAAPSPHFCLPKTAQIDANPPEAMAYAYLDFFEASASRIAGEDGRAAYIAAMVSKWPCAK